MASLKQPRKKRQPTWPDTFFASLRKARKEGTFLKDRYYKIVNGPSEKDVRAKMEKKESVVFEVREFRSNGTWKPCSMSLVPFSLGINTDGTITLTNPLQKAQWDPKTGKGVMVFVM